MPGGLLLPLPVPGFYHPLTLGSLTYSFLTHLPALPLPPQRPLQELEGTGFSSLSCLAAEVAILKASLAFLPGGHGVQWLERRISEEPGSEREGLQAVLTPDRTLS